MDENIVIKFIEVEQFVNISKYQLYNTTYIMQTLKL